MFTTISHNLNKYRWLAMALSLAGVAYMAMGLANLSFTNAYASQFGADNPQLLAYNQLIDDYEQSDNILIAISPHSGDIFDRDVLNLINELTKLAWQTPYSTRVDSLSNFVYTYGADDDLVSEPLFEQLGQLSDQQIRQRAAEALSEPGLRNALVSAKGDAGAVNITINIPRDNLQLEVKQANDYIAKILTELAVKYPQVDFYQAGKIVQDQAFFNASGADSATLFPLLLLIIFVVVFAILRSLIAGLAVLVTVIGTAMATLGIFGWQQMLLTPETLSAAIMIMPLAIADCVHVYMSFSKARAMGEQRQVAMISSIKANFKAIALTSITTALGFLSLTFAQSPSFVMMGYMVATGVMLAFVLCFTLFAPLLAILPMRTRQSRVGPKVSRFVTNLLDKKPTAWLIGLALLTLLTALGLSRNELNQNTAEYFDPNMTYRQNIQWIDQHLSGVNNIQYSIGAQDSQGITDPQYLQHLDKFTTWLRAQDKVVSATSFADVMKKLNKVMNDNDPSWYRLPEQRHIAAQYLTLYEMSLPYGMGITNQINFDKSASRVNIALNISSNKEIVAFDRKAQAWLSTNAPQYMHNNGTSPDIMYAYQLQHNIPGIVAGLVISVLLIALIMMFTLKSVRLGMISLLPNLLPMIIAFGLWGFIDGQVGLAVAIVMGMTLGIVVDDTVHFLCKYQEAKSNMMLDVKDAVAHALDNVGSALISTTSAVIAGFLVLTLSMFSPNADLGVLTALIIFIALIFDLLFLPLILVKLDKKHA